MRLADPKAAITQLYYIVHNTVTRLKSPKSLKFKAKQRF